MVLRGELRSGVRELMKLKSKRFLVFTCVSNIIIASVLGEGPHSNSQNLLGRLADIKYLQFQGNESFSDESLKTGLRGDLDFLLTFQPYAPCDIFAAQLTKSLLSGYAANGFPDAKITVTVSTQTSNILVHVSEGKQFTAGSIQTIGANTVLVQTLRNILTTDQLSDEEAPWNLRAVTSEDYLHR